GGRRNQCQSHHQRAPRLRRPRGGDGGVRRCDGSGVAALVAGPGGSDGTVWVCGWMGVWVRFSYFTHTHPPTRPPSNQPWRALRMAHPLQVTVEREGDRAGADAALTDGDAGPGDVGEDAGAVRHLERADDGKDVRVARRRGQPADGAEG